MSIQSDAAKEWLDFLFNHTYAPVDLWEKEYKFHDKRKWRFDYAVPVIRCAIELDGATFKPGTGHNTGAGLRGWREKNNAAMSLGWRVWHYSPEEVIKAGRKNRPEKSNHGAREGSIPPKSCSVTLPNEPILKELPWRRKPREAQIRTLSGYNFISREGDDEIEMEYYANR